jgi:hypothetical protein
VAAVNDLPIIDERRVLVAAPPSPCGVSSPRTSPALDSPARNSCPDPLAHLSEAVAIPAIPRHTAVGVVGREGSHRRDGSADGQLCATLVQANGLHVLGVLAVPVLLAGAGLIAVRSGRRGLLVAVMAALLVFCLVALASVGLFYLPAVAALADTLCEQIWSRSAALAAQVASDQGGCG